MLAATYPTKKALKTSIGSPLHYIETTMFKPEYRTDGTFPVVGPAPLNRKWYATVTMKDGLIKKVK